MSFERTVHKCNLFSGIIQMQTILKSRHRLTCVFTALVLAVGMLLTAASDGFAQPTREVPLGRREDPRSAQEARLLLNGLDAPAAYLAIHKRFGMLGMTDIESMMPYISLELTRKTLKEIQTRGIDESRVSDFVNLWRVFPQIQVTEVTRSQSNLAVLTILPKVGISARTANDVVAAVVEMRFEGGYWRLNSVTNQRTNDWCATATKDQPPQGAAYGSLMGQRFTVEKVTDSDAGLTFEFQSDRPTTALIDAPELNNIREKLQAAQGQRLEFKHPTVPGQRAYTFTPESTKISITSNGRGFSCTSGYGVTLILQNYRTDDLENKDMVDGSIILRIPDKERSFVEGSFTIEWPLSNSNSRRRR